MRRRTLLVCSLLAFAASGAVSLLYGCGGDDSSRLMPGAPGDAGGDMSVSDVRRPDAAGEGGVLESGVTSYCEAYKAWEIACGNPAPTCGDGGGAPDGGGADTGARDGGAKLDSGPPPVSYTTVCNAYDQNINSNAYRQAELMCLTPQNCAFANRYDCDYRALSVQQPTAAQQKLAKDYCATCSPGDMTCAQNALVYDAGAGALAISQIFIFGWEFSDSVTFIVDSMCTGPGLEAGAGPCDQAFSSCALGVVQRVPAAAAFAACQP